MAKLSARGADRRRVDRRFRPGAQWTAWSLDQRLLPSGGAALGGGHLALAAHAVHHARSVPAPRPTLHSSGRLSPAAEINAQYAQFLADFRVVGKDYVASLSESSSTTVAVSATVTANYTAGSPSIQVDDPAVFGPQGSFSSPVVATALVGSVPVGQFTLTGSSANMVTINVAQSSNTSLNAGTTLTANVPVSASSSAGSIFPSFITNRTGLLGITLVDYFDNLPVKLPIFNAPPHTPTSRGALQTYVYQQAVGSQSTSLQQALLAIPLPMTPGSDLQIYDAAVNNAVQQSRLLTLNGVQQIFAGNLRISAPSPANRLGTSANTGSTATSTTSSTGSSSSSGTGSSTSTSTG
jgi:hypothetical protein